MKKSTRSTIITLKKKDTNKELLITKTDLVEVRDSGNDEPFTTSAPKLYRALLRTHKPKVKHTLTDSRRI